MEDLGARVSSAPMYKVGPSGWQTPAAVNKNTTTNKTCSQARKAGYSKHGKQGPAGERVWHQQRGRCCQEDPQGGICPVKRGQYSFTILFWVAILTPLPLYYVIHYSY